MYGFSAYTVINLSVVYGVFLHECPNKRRYSSIGNHMHKIFNIFREGGRILEGRISHPFPKPLEFQGTIYNNVGEDT